MYSDSVSIPRANELQAFGVDTRQHVSSLMMLLMVKAVWVEEVDDFGRCIAAQVVGLNAVAEDWVVRRRWAYLCVF
jgi:hypothetical protein